MMRQVYCVCVALLCCLLAGCDLTRFAARALPVQDGTLGVPGLRAGVTVLRDEFGVPAIFAQDVLDLLFAQGYVMAQDRWWQMESARYYAKGRLGELVGGRESVASYDVYFRILDLAGAARDEVEIMDAETRRLAESFRDGINAYTQPRRPIELAVEYALPGNRLRQVEPWTLEDTVLLAKLNAWNLTVPAGTHLSYTEAESLLSAEDYALWNPPFPHELMPSILYPEDLEAPEEAASTSAQWKFAAASEPSTRPRPGTNGWVAAPELTETGGALLANDPHLSKQLPAPLYQMRLHAPATGQDPGLDVSGFAIPGIPGVIIGHNAAIGWGISNGMGDVWDNFELELNPDNPMQYRWNGQWVDFEVRRERFTFSGSTPALEVDIRSTVHGPILGENFVTKQGLRLRLSGFNNTNPTAVQWLGHEPSHLIRAVLALNRAEDWDAFREALRDFTIPSTNFGYVDTSGNIGYQFAGGVPLRHPDYDGLRLTPGTDEEFLWRGLVEFDDLPSVLNPERGFIVHANQALAPDAYYEALQALYPGANARFMNDYSLGYRAGRITELLASMQPLSVERFRQIQADTKMLSADILLPYLEGLDLGSAQLNAVRDWLLEWDRMSDVESAQAVLFAQFSPDLSTAIFQDEPLASVGYEDRSFEAMRLLLEQPDHPFWDDKRTPAVEDRDTLLRQVFAASFADRVRALGGDYTAWRWGDVHRITFQHSIAGSLNLKPLQELVNSPSFSMPGSDGTVNVAFWSYVTPKRDVMDTLHIAVFRIILDAADWDNSRAVNSTGQSGHPASPNYLDQVPLWVQNEDLPMRWSRAAIEAAAVNTLLLQPQ